MLAGQENVALTKEDLHSNACEMLPLNKKNVMSETILFVYPEPYFCQGGGISTYLKNAVKAHLNAGRNVKLLTWVTAIDGWYNTEFQSDDFLPLNNDDVIIVRIAEEEIYNKNPISTRAKNISDIMFPHIVDAVERFRPDLIEGSDYGAVLHSYLENLRAGYIKHNAPVAIFNHGMLADIWPASAMLASDYSLRELVMEEQVVEWSDYLLCPSEFAARNLKPRRKRDDILIVREPFHSNEWQLAKNFNPSKFLYTGRVSFAKGVDKLAGLLSSISLDWSIEEVNFVGRVVDTPFRQTDAKKLIQARCPILIRDKLKFTGPLEREEMLNILPHYGFSVNFSRSETFSYTSLEAISRGVAPLIMLDSPMAEFLPDDLKSDLTFATLPHRREDVLPVLNAWKSNYAEIMLRIQRYAEGITSFESYARSYDKIIEDGRLNYSDDRQGKYKSTDISFLICSYNDADVLVGAVESIKKQTESIAEIIILNDGTNDPDKLEVLQSIRKQSNIRVLDVPNMGLVAGRNYLVENCSTNLAVFMDSDDLITEDFVEKCLRALNTCPEKWGAVITRRKNFGLNSHEQASFLLGSPVHWIMNDFRMTALIKTEILRKIPFKPDMRNGEADDWWWWLSFTINGYEANFVPEPLFLYRTEMGSMSIPWSEGQAALTAEMLCDLAKHAFRRGYDVGPVVEVALRTAYRLRRENDIAQSELANRGLPNDVVNHNFVQWQFLIANLSSVIGIERANRLARFAERSVTRSPIIRRMGRLVLKSVSSVRRSRR